MVELEEVPSLSCSNLASFVTDNGSNMIRAFNLLGWPHVCYFSHTFNLAVEEVFKIPAVETKATIITAHRSYAH